MQPAECNDTGVRALTDSDLAWADVALVSGMLVQKNYLLDILARCRARGVRTVVGGPIASGFGELPRYADHVVVGEAEELIGPLAEDLRDANGNNIECNLSFVPAMSAQRLVDGYPSILKRIYTPEAYYERARRRLARCHPTIRMRRPFSDYLALYRSVVKQGIFGEARASYWKFLIAAATRYRHAFGAAVTLAIMGYHFHAVTEEACRTD